MYVCKHTYINTHMYKPANTYTYANIYIYTCIYEDAILELLCTYICIRICKHIYVYKFWSYCGLTYAYVYANTYTYINTYICKNAILEVLWMCVHAYTYANIYKYVHVHYILHIHYDVDRKKINFFKKK